MSVFTDKEIEYIRSQRLGRLATVRPDGTPQNAPVGFHYNAELDVIEIGGRSMSQSKKFRNIVQNPNVAFVIDDVLPPWQPRFVEIRGTARTGTHGRQGAIWRQLRGRRRDHPDHAAPDHQLWAGRREPAGRTIVRSNVNSVGATGPGSPFQRTCRRVVQ